MAGPEADLFLRFQIPYESEQQSGLLLKRLTLFLKTVILPDGLVFLKLLLLSSACNKRHTFLPM